MTVLWYRELLPDYELLPSYSHLGQWKCLLVNIDVFVEWEVRQPNRDASCMAFQSIYLIYVSIILYLSII